MTENPSYQKDPDFMPNEDDVKDLRHFLSVWQRIFQPNPTDSVDLTSRITTLSAEWEKKNILKDQDFIFSTVHRIFQLLRRKTMKTKERQEPLQISHPKEEAIYD